ncbi:retrovirus-related pol polyprotein from transposon TNT 1-94 [Tanacetum coccineum]
MDWVAGGAWVGWGEWGWVDDDMGDRGGRGGLRRGGRGSIGGWNGMEWGGLGGGGKLGGEFGGAVGGRGGRGCAWEGEGGLGWAVGERVYQSPCGIFISQSQYTIELLKKHGLDECVSMSTPMATERLDANLQGTPTDQTTYHRMIGDADHAGCKDDCKSTSGGLQFLGGKLMRTQLLDYGYKYNRIPMYCDSKSAIAISCNPVQHSKTKHIDIQYHFIKEHVEKGIVELYFVGT